MNWLNVLLFLPLLAAIVMFLAGRLVKNDNVLRGLALALSLLPLAVNLLIMAGYAYNAASGEFQYYTTLDWIAAFGITYTVGLDGLSLPLVFLTSLLTPLVVLVSFDEHKKLGAYFGLLFLLECGLFGVFAALDFFLFYLF